MTFVLSFGVWLLATGVYFSLGGYEKLGVAGLMVYLGVCVVGGSISSRMFD